MPKRGLELIKEFEGCELTAYPDPIYGWEVPTIGYGTTVYPSGGKVKQGDTITIDQAENFLVSHVEAKCRPYLEKIPTWVEMNINQRGALYSFAYNVGSAFYDGEGFASITTVCDSPDRWDDRDWVTAQFIKYRNPGTDAEEGLRRRRQAEADLFCA